MKKLLPILLLLLGLGGGVGAGIALKPPAADASVACGAEAGHGAVPAAAGEETESTEAEAVAPEAAAACPEAHDDPFAPVEAEKEDPAEAPSYVAFEKPFVVPVFDGNRTIAMVVISLSVATNAEGVEIVTAAQPRLRDSFLKIMFRHANSGGFSGSYTEGQKMDDLKSGLLASAREVMGKTPVREVLVTEIAKQDM